MAMSINDLHEEFDRMNMRIKSVADAAVKRHWEMVDMFAGLRESMNKKASDAAA